MTPFTLWIRSVGQSDALRHAWRRRRPLPRMDLFAGAFVLALLLAASPPVLPVALAAPPDPVLSDSASQLLPRARAELTGAAPSYFGLDTVHVSYEYATCGECRSELQVVMPDASVEMLTTLTAGSVTGSFQHDGLVPGSYGYRIVEMRLSDGAPIYTTTLRSATVDGLTIGGALLFDETLSASFECESLGGVTVNDGLELSLDGAALGSNCTIILAGSAALAAQGSDFGGDDLTIGGTGTAEIAGSTFSTPVTLEVGPDAIVSITQSHFPHALRVGGVPRHLRFQSNYFADVVRLLARSAVTFFDNHFLSSISIEDVTVGADSWCQDNGLRPTIEDNGFVGRNALGHSITTCDVVDLSPIDVGPNYYGDPQGPVYGQNQDDPVVPGIVYGKKWLQRGAVVVPNMYTLAPALKSGLQWQDTRDFPTFWLNGYRLGQHTLTNQIPAIIRDKESLFTVDLVTSHERVEGAKVWVEWNGLKVIPSSPASATPSLVRDTGRSAAVLRTGGTTIDFFLPPTTGETASLKLWLDTRAVSGFVDAGSSGALTKLLEVTVTLKSPPPVVGIHIVPVTVDSVTPSIGGVRSTLESVTPAMLPVTPEKLRISATSYSPGWNSAYVPTGLLVNAVATDLVRYRSAMRYDPVEFPKGELMDFVVGVMPAGSLGADGVYMNLRQGIVLVDENKPEAVFHEMGHAIGLYNLVEQYSWPRYPPNGRPVEGVTLFLNQSTTSNATVNAVFPGGSGRVVHAPALGQWWYDPFLGVVDVMGNADPFWPHPDTLQSFATHLYSLATEPRPTATSTGVESGLRRVLVTVDTERVEVTEVSYYQGERRCAAYRPLIETARLLPRDAFTPVTGGETGDPDVTTGALPLCLTDDGMLSAPGDIELCIMPIDDAGGIMPEFWTCQRVLAPGEVNTARQRDVAALYFGMPITATRASLVTTRGQAEPHVLTASVALSVTLATPTAGQTLTDTVTLRWHSEAALRDPGIPGGQPLLYQAAASSDGGATWLPLGLPVEGTSMVLSTDSLPSGGPLALRVTVSDGFLTNDDAVGGLVVPHHAPEAVIISPHEGDRAPVGTTWLLQAWGWDREAGASLAGTWGSSRDGLLGSGPLLSGVVLSPGTHVLTYTVTDGSAISSAAYVSLVVEAMPTVDLAIPPDALAIQMPWRDPVAKEALRLATGVPQTATVKLRNTGVAVTATLQLFVTPPGGAGRLVAAETVSLAPFETRWVGGVVTATVAGPHRFRGVVTALSPLDGASGNDVRQWDVTAVSPARLAASASTVEFVAPAGTPIDRAITLSNTGGLGVVVQRAELEAGAALSTGFRVWGDGCSGTPLAPGASCRVTVRYTPAAGGEERVSLEISSTDPDQPAQQVALTGRVGEPATAHVYLPLVVK